MFKPYRIILLAAIVSMSAAVHATAVVPGGVVDKFRELDRDENGSLSIEEYIGRGEPADLIRRDFLIFDFDQNGSLSFDEFAPIAIGSYGHVRGPVPDPLVTIVNQFVNDLNTVPKTWQARPNDLISLDAFAGALPPGFEAVLSPQVVQQGDADRDGRVSQQEARRFLEIQFGLRLPDGRPLRTPNGQVNNYLWFRRSDNNSNEQIEWSEFMTQTGGGEEYQKMFLSADQDGDLILSIDEWFISKWTFADPIEKFRSLDTNLDGFLDTAELVQGSQSWNRAGVHQLVKAFDADRDGRMSMAEYRLSPHDNAIQGWQESLPDTDRDRKLSFDEYRSGRPLFPMLSVYYFQKFDQNHDGFLDASEYDFRTEQPVELYAMNADGTGLKKLDVGNNVRFGSPAVSHDGKWIAFDGTSDVNSDFGSWRIQVMPIAGGNPRPICHGVMPTWSKDDSKLTCSRFAPQAGIWVVDVNGQYQQFITPGWGSQWSPDGEKIYFNNENSMWIYNLVSKQADVTNTDFDHPEHILKSVEAGYARFDSNATWSPDGERICINARRRSNPEISDILIVDLTANGEGKVNVRYSSKSIGADFAWHPNGRQIICSMYCAERERQQFYTFHPDVDEGPLTLIPGQLENKTAMDIAWTPDGKQIVFTVRSDE